jgi:hypothetical protein
MGTRNFTGDPGQNISGPGGATDLVLVAGSDAGGKIGPSGSYGYQANTSAVEQLYRSPDTPASQDYYAEIERVAAAYAFDTKPPAIVRMSADGLTRYEAVIDTGTGTVRLYRVVGGVRAPELGVWSVYARAVRLAVSGVGATVTLTVTITNDENGAVVTHPAVTDAHANRITATGYPGCGWIAAASATNTSTGGVNLVRFASDQMGEGGGDPMPPPTIDSIDSPGAGTSITAGSVQLAATLGGGAADSVAWYRGDPDAGGTLLGSTNPYLYDVTGRPDGVETLYVSATNVGGTDTDSRALTIGAGGASTIILEDPVREIRHPYATAGVLEVPVVDIATGLRASPSLVAADFIVSKDGSADAVISTVAGTVYRAGVARVPVSVADCTAARTLVTFSRSGYVPVTLAITTTDHPAAGDPNGATAAGTAAALALIGATSVSMAATHGAPQGGDLLIFSGGARGYVESATGSGPYTCTVPAGLSKAAASGETWVAYGGAGAILSPAERAAGAEAVRGVLPEIDNLDTPVSGQGTLTAAQVRAEMDASSTKLAAIATDAGSAASSAAAVAGRLTTTRAGYLDKLNVPGQVSSSQEVTSIQNNTDVVRSVPVAMDRPTSGATSYLLEFFTFDGAGVPMAPDAAPTLAATNVAGVSRASHLDSTTMTLVALGWYRATYTVQSTDPKEQINFHFTVLRDGVASTYPNQAQVTDAAATDYTTADRTRDQATAAALADMQAVVSGLLPVSAYEAPNNTAIATLVARLGAITGSGANTVLGLLRALGRKDAPVPSDLGGTYNPATDSAEAREEQAAALAASLAAGVTLTTGARDAVAGASATATGTALAPSLSSLAGQVGTPLQEGDYTPAPSAGTIADVVDAVLAPKVEAVPGAVRTELADELEMLDLPISEVAAAPLALDSEALAEIGGAVNDELSRRGTVAASPAPAVGAFTATGAFPTATNALRRVLVTFTSGANKGLARKINGATVATGGASVALTFATAWPVAPAAGDTFRLHGGA